IDHQSRPTWTLYDPIRRKFFQLGWLEHEILKRWNLSDTETIAASIREETPFDTSADTVNDVAAFVVGNHLVRANDGAGVAKLAAHRQRSESGIWQRLFHGYLFFRIPLVSPDGFLTRTLPIMNLLASRVVGIGLVLAAILGLHLTARQWDEFSNTFVHVFSVEGALFAFGAIALAKIGHEFGHGYAAKRYGCHVPVMGVAFIVAWPVLFTDVTDAWKLPDHRKRARIALAGVKVELALAALATLVWSFLPDGPLRTAAVLLATTTWLTSLAVNLNPFMRFDGYYLLSDLLRMPNLQERAFAQARWQMREWLFGWNAPPEVDFSPRLRLGLTIYAFGTWVYRLALYLGIAFLVYHFTIKLAGVVLMAIEIAWFIALPGGKECLLWWRSRQRIGLGMQTVRAVLLLALLIAALFVPWQSRVRAPGVLMAVAETTIYPAAPAMIVSVAVSPGQRVRQGDKLFQLASPDIDSALRRIGERIAGIRWQLEHMTASNSELLSARVLSRRLGEALAEKRGLEAKQRRQIILAPFAGTLRELDDGLVPGRWYDAATPLALLVDESSTMIEVYVSETELQRIAVGGRAEFYLEDFATGPIMARIATIDPLPTGHLDHPELASVHGGPIAVREGAGGRFQPDQAIYRLRLQLDRNRPAPAQIRRGMAFIDGERASLADRLWRQVVAVMLAESGF
ncbi:MAG: HlyD family efflux transporter periplasmic adaptor subunit, partial [Rhodospirillaceae bacterium]|nr:HlyD family efflux transporter periplasmic adaptor subunit [Rhodospirillaceae bacterium]